MRNLAAEFGFTAQLRWGGEEAQQIKRQARAKARWWVVERPQRKAPATAAPAPAPGR